MDVLLTQVAGIDFGSKKDYSAVCIAQVTNNGLNIEAIYRFLGPYKEQLPQIANLVDSVDFAVVDATGVGVAVSEVLQGLTRANVVNFTFTQKSKSELMSTLLQAVHGRYITVQPYAPGAADFRDELFNFKKLPTRKGFKYTGKRVGKHDDMVMAAALCIRAALISQ